MRLCRFDNNRIGLVRGGSLHDVTGIVDTLLPPLRHPMPLGDHLIANVDALRPGMERLADTTPPRPLEETRLLSRSPIHRRSSARP